MQSWLPLILFAVVATGTPGMATMLATASGAQFGFRRSLPLLIGSACGLAGVAAASAAGLASLLLAVPSLQLAMKIAGSAYLLWLALKIGRNGAPKTETAMQRPTRFMGGAGLQWVNPKGWAMTFGAAASFAALAQGPTQLAALLAMTFGVAALAMLCIWCLAGFLLARILRTERQWRILN